MLKKAFTALFIAMAAFAMAATTEVVVTAKVVHQENGYALKIGEEMIPLRAYEVPLCLATAQEPVKLALKLEGEPPKVVAVTVLEGPCPPGTELPASVKERVEAMLRKGYVNAKGELVREQNRWMLRIGDTEVPVDPEALPPCLRKHGVEVEVAVLEGDEGELTLAKDGCVAQVAVKAQLREQLRKTLRSKEEMGEEKPESPAAKAHETMHEQHEAVKKQVQEHVEKAKEEMHKKAEEVKKHVPTPKMPGNDHH